MSLGSPDRRRLDDALQALRACVVAAAPDPLSTLTIRTQHVEGNAGRVEEVSAGGGVYVRVDGIPIGRTLPDGTLTAKVPSGSISVSAIVPPNAFGVADVRISPGAIAAATIVLDDAKEPSDETDLVLEEAMSGTLRADTTSLTLQFMTNDRPLAVEEIQEVDVLDDSGVESRDLTRRFAISGTAIVAIDATTMLEALSAVPSASLRLRVAASDQDGFVHDGVVEFRIQKPAARPGRAADPLVRAGGIRSSESN